MDKPRRESALVQQETRRPAGAHTYTCRRSLVRGQSSEAGLGNMAVSKHTDKNDVWTEEFAMVLARIRPAVDLPELPWLHLLLSGTKR